MIVGMKNENNDSEAVTRGILRETLSAALDGVVTKISAKIDEKIDGAIGDLAIMVEKGFQGMTKQVDGQFDKVFSELRDIHKEIEVNKLKTQGDIAGIDFRVGKLEKKAGLS